MSKEGLL
ncbi:hypothetical protein F383_13182 [Gossypium arboreum]|nr:hypothetical protein F383_13182 [Gossypium arboreum]